MYVLRFKFDDRKYLQEITLESGRKCGYASKIPTIFKTKKEAITAKSNWGIRGCWILEKYPALKQEDKICE